ncbi:hypothetical protein MMC06_002915 [Schaereria dolodes]|nr:hypothetical protein [Schaereria dolodes]
MSQPRVLTEVEHFEQIRNILYVDGTMALCSIVRNAVGYISHHWGLISQFLWLFYTHRDEQRTVVANAAHIKAYYSIVSERRCMAYTMVEQLHRAGRIGNEEIVAKYTLTVLMPKFNVFRPLEDVDYNIVQCLSQDYVLELSERLKWDGDIDRTATWYTEPQIFMANIGYWGIKTLCIIGQHGHPFLRNNWKIVALFMYRRFRGLHGYAPPSSLELSFTIHRLFDTFTYRCAGTLVEPWEDVDRNIVTEFNQTVITDANEFGIEFSREEVLNLVEHRRKELERCQLAEMQAVARAGLA